MGAEKARKESLKTSSRPSMLGLLKWAPRLQGPSGTSEAQNLSLRHQLSLLSSSAHSDVTPSSHPVTSVRWSTQFSST